MPIFEVPVAVLPAFSFALQTIKEGIPSRYQKIADYLQEFVSRNPATATSTCVKIGHSGQTVPCDIFDRGKLKLLHEAIILSPTKESFLGTLDFTERFPKDSDVQPVVLIPIETACETCNGLLITESRASVVSLYTVSGCRKASSFHKRCRACQVSYFISYKVDKNGNRQYKPQCLSDEFILTSSITGFGTLYLRTISDLIETAALTFTAAVESYTVTHNVHLERQRLEDAYFLFRLISVSDECQEILQTQKGDNSNRIDVESACQDMVEGRSFDDNEYIKHSCNTLGCKEGFAMADGIEKIHRRICAAPVSAIKLARNMPRIVTCCICTPQFSTKSKFCERHQYLAEDEKSTAKRPRIVVTIDTIGLRVSTNLLPSVDNLPSNEDTTVHVGCKEAAKVNRFYNRTAGVMAIVRPCGIIVDYSEMLTNESPSQLFVQLLRLVCDSGIDLKYLGYDRACEFDPFLRNLQKKGNDGAKILLEKMSFLVDRFHIKGHTTSKCDIDNPECAYHPDLIRFRGIHGVNTECAEQAFAWLGKFKHIVKYMTHFKYKFFLFLIVRARNSRIVKRLKDVDQPQNS